MSRRLSLLCVCPILLDYLGRISTNSFASALFICNACGLVGSLGSASLGVSKPVDRVHAFGLTLRLSRAQSRGAAIGMASTLNKPYVHAWLDSREVRILITVLRKDSRRSSSQDS